MKRIGIFFCVSLILMMAAGTVFATGVREPAPAAPSATSGAAGQPLVTHFPRNETLYLSGLQWGAPSGNQPFNQNAHALAGNGQRQLVYETLFVYNMLTGSLEPQLATSFSFGGTGNRVLTVQLNPNAKFRGGAAVTAADVVNVFQLGKDYQISISPYWDYIESVTAQGNTTVILTGKADNYNRQMMLRAISEVSITPKAYWDAKKSNRELGNGRSDLLGFPGWDCYGSGPYTFYFADDTKLVLIRDESYWGVHSSHRGKLPTPKYVINNVYSDNAAGDNALRTGNLDIIQQFTAQVETYFQYGVATYLPQAPYHIPAVIPSIWFNTQKPGLNDPAVRRAIAMVIDYARIGSAAMSGQTALKEPHMMLATTAEKALIDEAALRPYQWTGIDTAGANKLLDDAGWVRGTDGIRAKGGVRLAFQISCPFGWSDWNASCEIVADSVRTIGISIETYFPEMQIAYDNRFTGNFDITMWSAGGSNASSPWSRAYDMFVYSYLPPAGTPNNIGNFGRYQNPRAQELTMLIANESDAAKLKEYWTALNILYLQEMPQIGLMYRPDMFHIVNTTNWTNYPRAGDGTNIPPTCFIDGAGIKGLFQITPVRR